jgi:YD repeat-containing protein
VGPAHTAAGICYAPQGALQSLTLYNGVSEQWSFNTLQRPTQLAATAGSTALMSLGWSYNTGADNGNVTGHTISRSSGLAAPLSQTYGYLDPANRLYSASETGGWSQTFNYDAFGNRAVAAGSYLPNGGVTPVQGAPANQFPNNQWIRGAVSTSADKYDGAGNQIQLAQADGVYVTPASTFAYDGENRLLTASIGNQNGATFAYDGEGRRVQKTSASGVVTTYVHDAMGNLAMELSTAAPAAAGTQYLTADFLGSTRLITNGSGRLLLAIPGSRSRGALCPQMVSSS